MNFTDFILGFAIGDAFGAGVEFQDRNWIRANVDFTQFVNARHLIPSEKDPEAFTRNYVPWSYSDDTEMLLGVIRALASNQPFTEALLIESWAKEYELGEKRNGYGRNGHGSMAWYYSGKMSIDEIRSFQQNRPYPGNAPVMRGAVIGLLPSNMIQSYAIINANATHPHPKARTTSIAIAFASEFLCVRKGNPTEIIPYCLSVITEPDSETVALLQQVDQLPRPDLLGPDEYTVLCGPQPITAPRFPVGINGVPSDAMITCAVILYILKHAKSPIEGLKLAVSLGGDTDTVAAVCCGILSANSGLTSIPLFMQQELKEQAYLREMATLLEKVIC